LTAKSGNCYPEPADTEGFISLKEFDIENKVVLITGASSGIGRATAVAFAREKAKIALIGRNESALNKVAEEISSLTRKENGSAQVFPLDLSHLDRIPETVARVGKELGGTDILINNAAYAVGGLVEDCPVDQYKKNFEVNFCAPLALIQAVLPGMKQRRSGQIINLTSGVGRRALPGFSSYSATKFALNALTESLRVEVKPFGINVISVSPGRVSSSFHHRIEFYGRWKTELPPMNMRTPEQIAELILNASKKRAREVTVWGPGLWGYHLNYWAPKLADWILAKKYRFTKENSHPTS
jgi:short-subunit dehydrogenase